MSLTGAHGARVAREACEDGEKGDDENHQESMMGGGATQTIFRAAKFMQGVFTAIEQLMQVPIRAADSRATMAMKAFLQLRPPTFKGEPNPLVAED